MHICYCYSAQFAVQIQKCSFLVVEPGLCIQHAREKDLQDPCSKFTQIEACTYGVHDGQKWWQAAYAPSPVSRCQETGPLFALTLAIFLHQTVPLALCYEKMHCRKQSTMVSCPGFQKMTRLDCVPFPSSAHIDNVHNPSKPPAMPIIPAPVSARCLLRWTFAGIHQM